MNKYCFKFLILAIHILTEACAPKIEKLTKIPNLPDLDKVQHDLLKVIGVKEKNMPEVSYDSDLLKYRDEFITEAESYNKPISQNTINSLRVIKYVNRLSQGSGPSVVAACNRYKTKHKRIGGGKVVKWKEIEVLKDRLLGFASGEELRIRLILYHEFFHCFYDKSHLPADKRGIMSAVLYRGNGGLFKTWHQQLADMFSDEYMNIIPDIDF